MARWFLFLLGLTCSPQRPQFPQVDYYELVCSRDRTPRPWTPTAGGGGGRGAGGGPVPTTVRHVHGVLRRALGQAAREGAGGPERGLASDATAARRAGRSALDP